jgi:alpha-D-xyloside xylohydrolase
VYGTNFMDDFRRTDELKYQLMPYVYAQAKDSSQRGLPMVRALFIEYPDDPGSWLVDDEYLYGSSILVAPLFDEGSTSRNVYLPPGTWIDYQSQTMYTGGWQKITAGKVPIIMLVRDGTVIPQIKLAQSTMQMDWSNLELVAFTQPQAESAHGLVCLPSDNSLHELSLVKLTDPGAFRLREDPLGGKVTWRITQVMGQTSETPDSRRIRF